MLPLNKKKKFQLQKFYITRYNTNNDIIINYTTNTCIRMNFQTCHNLYLF